MAALIGKIMHNRIRNTIIITMEPKTQKATQMMEKEKQVTKNKRKTNLKNYMKKNKQLKTNFSVRNHFKSFKIIRQTIINLNPQIQPVTHM